MAVDQVASAELVTPHHILTMHRMLMARSPSPEFGGIVRDRQNWVGGTDFNPCAAEFVPPPPEFVEHLPELFGTPVRDNPPVRGRQRPYRTSAHPRRPASSLCGHPVRTSREPCPGNGQPCLHHGIERLPIRRPTWFACRARSDAQMDRGIPRGHGARCGRCGSARTGSRRTRGSLAIGGVAASRKRRRPRSPADHYSSRRDG